MQALILYISKKSTCVLVGLLIILAARACLPRKNYQAVNFMGSQMLFLVQQKAQYMPYRPSDHCTVDR